MRLKNKLTFTTLLVSAVFAVTIRSASAIETPAKNAIIMDFETGQYIYTKDHQKMIPPASMSKLMTIYMIFEKLKDGSLSLDDTFTVSENAWRKGGAASGSSTMFLKIGEKVTVRDIIHGIIIQSGNDACIVAAENLAGSEEDFATEMQKKARQIGMKHSSFANATGWPHPDQLMSVEDLAKLARAIISQFPEYYYIFSEHTFTHNNIKQGNRNPLLYSMQYADGLKTGHTEDGTIFSYTLKKYGDEVTLDSVDIIPTWVNRYNGNNGYLYTIYPLEEKNWGSSKYNLNSTAAEKAAKSYERTEKIISKGLYEIQKKLGCDIRFNLEETESQTTE